MKGQHELLGHFRSVLVTHLNAIVPDERGSFSDISSIMAEQEPMDEADVAAVGHEIESLIRLNGRNRNLIRQIREALRRIEMGEFGICEECGCGIGVERLKAQPMTTLCIECQRTNERMAKRAIRQLS